MAKGGIMPALWLRFQPGLAVKTHAYTQTGQEDSKFGMDREDILKAVEIIRRHGLPLSGLHFHLGSQFRDPAPLRPGIQRALDLAVEMGFEAEWNFSPGGGWGVAYHEDELPQPDVKEYIRFMAETVFEGCKQRSISLPRLRLEPGRSLVARAGVAVYRVGSVKRSGKRTWVLLDGGLADNPRYALYGARYSALAVKQPNRPNEETAWLAGPYCESGDCARSRPGPSKAGTRRFNRHSGQRGHTNSACPAITMGLAGRPYSGWRTGRRS